MLQLFCCHIYVDISTRICALLILCLYSKHNVTNNIPVSTCYFCFLKKRWGIPPSHASHRRDLYTLGGILLGRLVTCITCPIHTSDCLSELLHCCNLTPSPLLVVISLICICVFNHSFDALLLYSFPVLCLTRFISFHFITIVIKKKNLVRASSEKRIILVRFVLLSKFNFNLFICSESTLTAWRFVTLACKRHNTVHFTYLET